MSRDNVIGLGLMIGAIIAVVLIVYLLFFTEVALLVMKIIISVAVIGLAGIVAWVGYTLVTTPSPKPIKEIEKEIEEELTKLEASSRGEKTSSERVK